jgi:O-antigen/teichoic acid export membrane protein
MSKLSTRLISSSSLSVLAKVIQRVIGLVSLLILARLLSPEDFAIAALTSMFIYFFDMLSNLGSEQYIIQKKQLNDNDLNTAWSLDIIVKSVLFLLLIAVTPLIAFGYEKPELILALSCAALVLPMNALRNPSLFLLKRELNYNAIFWLSVIQKICSFTVVILIAVNNPSYWAMIVGDVVASLVFTVGSYWIIRYKPSFSLDKISIQWLFSRWMIPKGIIGYLRSQIDTFMVSIFFNQSILGQYHVARNIVLLPSHNLMIPAIEPLLAAFKSDKTNVVRKEFQVRVSLWFASLLIAPITVFIWLFPNIIVFSLLGEQWQQSVTIVKHLALLAYYFPFLLILEQYMIATEKLDKAFWFDLISLSIIACGLCFITNSSIEVFALWRGILGLVVTLALLFYLNTKIKLEPLKFILFGSANLVIAYLSGFLTMTFLSSVQFPEAILLLLNGSVFISLYCIFTYFFLLLIKKIAEEANYLVLLLPKSLH